MFGVKPLDDKYLKRIAEELTLIRKEQELQNNLIMQDMGMIPRPDEEVKEQHKPKPDIASQLSEMFKR